jgi:hypothetical protein
MVFDGAEAELIGTEGEGLAAMFMLMNHARLDVALQGVAHAARASALATSYASERRQGRKSDGTVACLSDHADVRRMLNEQESLAIGARAMCHIALVEIELGADPALAEFLTSLCKVYGSEAGTRAADLGMQILGGYGYLTEYGMEQIWRDARICAIYEGTNGIHCRSLVTRGLRPGGGAEAFEAFIAREVEGTTALEKWRASRSKVMESEDPHYLARVFYEDTARLFETAVWTRIKNAARHNRYPERMAALADIVLARAER